MRVAISTDSGYVSQHFGRCPLYTLVDIKNGKEVKRIEIENPGHSPGAIPRFLYEKGVKEIICGGIGARAIGFFEEFGIKVISGVEGEINDVIEKLLNGRLKGGVSACTPGEGKGYGVDKTECDHSHAEY